MTDLSHVCSATSYVLSELCESVLSVALLVSHFVSSVVLVPAKCIVSSLCPAAHLLCTTHTTQKLVKSPCYKLGVSAKFSKCGQNNEQFISVDSPS